MNTEFEIAKKELGEQEYNKRYRKIFNKPVLDFVQTLVFNLPNPCYCDCPYCIDVELRRRQASEQTWYKNATKMLQVFPNAKHVTITGGTISSVKMTELMVQIINYLDKPEITWNTNGVIDEVDPVIRAWFDHVNLHRQSLNEEENRTEMGYWSHFYPMITLKEAKKIFGEKLAIRTIIDTKFDLDYWAHPKIPLFLNRQLPVTAQSNQDYLRILKQIKLDNTDKRRNNLYISGTYNKVPIRIGVGDNTYEHIPGREPVYLNVAILHRTGVISGTWYEDDKVLLKP